MDKSAIISVLRGLRGAVGYFGAFFALGMVISSLGPTLPYLAESVGVSMADAGALFSVRSLGYLLGSLFLGRAYDRLPGNRLLAGLLCLGALTVALTPLSPLLAVMSLLLWVTGLCLGGMDVGGNTLTVWIYGSKAGPYLNGLFLCAGVGGLIIPLIAGALVEAGQSVLWVYWVMAALILPVAAWLVFVPAPGMPAARREGQAGRVNVLLVALFGALFFLYVSIETSFGGWIYSYVLSYTSAGAAVASALNSLFWLALTVGRLVAIPVAARARPITIARLDLLGVLASLALILAFPRALSAVGVGTFGLGFSLASALPATYALAERRLRISGRLTGVLWACGSLGAVITPWFIGQFMARLGPAALVVTLMVYVGLALGILGVLWAQFKSGQIIPGARGDD